MRFFSSLLNILYDKTENFIGMLFFITLFLFIVKTIVFYLNYKKNIANIRLYPKIREIKDKHLPPEEEAEEIYKISPFSIVTLLPYAVTLLSSFLSFFLVIPMIRPYQYLSSLSSDTIIPFLFYDNIFAKKFDVIMPLVLMAIDLLGYIFVPSKRKNSKVSSIVISVVTVAAINVLFSLFFSRCYFVYILFSRSFDFIYLLIKEPTYAKVRAERAKLKELYPDIDDPETTEPSTDENETIDDSIEEGVSNKKEDFDENENLDIIQDEKSLLIDDVNTDSTSTGDDINE